MRDICKKHRKCAFLISERADICELAFFLWSCLKPWLVLNLCIWFRNNLLFVSLLYQGFAFFFKKYDFLWNSAVQICYLEAVNLISEQPDFWLLLFFLFGVSNRLFSLKLCSASLLPLACDLQAPIDLACGDRGFTGLLHRGEAEGSLWANRDCVEDKCICPPALRGYSHASWGILQLRTNYLIPGWTANVSRRHRGWGMDRGLGWEV